MENHGVGSSQEVPKTTIVELLEGLGLAESPLEMVEECPGPMNYARIDDSHLMAACAPPVRRQPLAH